MKPSQKRTSTQLGLGKVSDEPRQTSKRERFGGADTEPASVPPISAPSPSGGPTSSPPAVRHTRALESNRPRHTRSLESNPPSEGERERERDSKDDVAAARSVDAERGVDRTPSPPPGSVRGEPLERIELDADRAAPSMTGAASSRTPIEVTQVDTKRLPRAAASAKPSDGREGRFPAEEPTGRRAIAGRARGDDRADPGTDTKPPGSRTVDGRPIGKRADSGRPVSARPATGRPASAGPASGRPASSRPGGRAASGRPGSARPASVAPAARSPSPPPVFAKSQRPSIREDIVGLAVTADAVGGNSRAVPKLLMTKAEIAAAPIDHRAGFLLAHIDGVTAVAGLVDICGMTEEEVDEILDRLRRLGIVAVR